MRGATTILCLLVLAINLLFTINNVQAQGDEFVHPSKCPEIVKQWQDSPVATQFWQFMHDNNLDALREFVKKEPCAVHVRSKDGRGPVRFFVSKKSFDIEHHNANLTAAAWHSSFGRLSLIDMKPFNFW